jgi:hypothetical protein
MGGQHEQSRSDRDKYVEIAWANVQGGTGNYNMQKLSTQDNKGLFVLSSHRMQHFMNCSG